MSSSPTPLLISPVSQSISSSQFPLSPLTPSFDSAGPTTTATSLGFLGDDIAKEIQLFLTDFFRTKRYDTIKILCDILKNSQYRCNNTEFSLPYEQWNENNCVGFSNQILSMMNNGGGISKNMGKVVSAFKEDDEKQPRHAAIVIPFHSDADSGFAIVEPGCLCVAVGVVRHPVPNLVVQPTYSYSNSLANDEKRMEFLISISPNYSVEANEIRVNRPDTSIRWRFSSASISDHEMEIITHMILSGKIFAFSPWEDLVKHLLITLKTSEEFVIAIHFNKNKIKKKKSQSFRTFLIPEDKLLLDNFCKTDQDLLSSSLMSILQFFNNIDSKQLDRAWKFCSVYDK